MERKKWLPTTGPSVTDNVWGKQYVGPTGMTVAGTQTTAWPQLQSYALAATMVNQMVAGYQQSWLEQTGEQIVLAPQH